MRINDWLARASSRLNEADIRTHRLDAELILAHAIGKPRTWILAHSDEIIDDRALIHHANTMLTKRAHRMPLAYLTGIKEFYGREFVVTPNVLIPRPETETIIDLLKKYVRRGKVIDVGCGSGCIGITAKLEVPELHVTLADVSENALELAKENAALLGADVSAHGSNLLLGSSERFDVILANLPYVDSEWQRSPETDHEPSLALFAGERGLALINSLLEQAPTHLDDDGYLMLEADPMQHDAIIKTGAQIGLRLIEAKDYIVVMQKS